MVDVWIFFFCEYRKGKVNTQKSVSIECRQIEARVITMANWNTDRYHDQSERRENASDLVTIGFSFASYWLQG